MALRGRAAVLRARQHCRADEERGKGAARLAGGTSASVPCGVRHAYAPVRVTGTHTHMVCVRAWELPLTESQGRVLSRRSDALVRARSLPPGPDPCACLWVCV